MFFKLSLVGVSVTLFKVPKGLRQGKGP